MSTRTAAWPAAECPATVPRQGAGPQSAPAATAPAGVWPAAAATAGLRPAAAAAAGLQPTAAATRATARRSSLSSSGLRASAGRRDPGGRARYSRLAERRARGRLRAAGHAGPSTDAASVRAADGPAAACRGETTRRTARAGERVIFFYKRSLVGVLRSSCWCSSPCVIRRPLFIGIIFLVCSPIHLAVDLPGNRVTPDETPGRSQVSGHGP